MNVVRITTLLGAFVVLLMWGTGCPSKPEPAIGVSASEHDFGEADTNWSFQVWNAGDANTTLAWNASADKAWLGLNPTSGTSSGPEDKGTINVTVDRGNLAKSEYTGTITISAEGLPSKTVAVIVEQAPVPIPPMAAFSADPTTGDAPLEVEFTDQSEPGSAAITTWQWDFGDGSEGSERNEQHPVHTYAAPGTYTVGLTVTSSAGQDTETKTDYITATAPPQPPVAAFTADVTSHNAPATITFTDQSDPGSAAITSWLWDFGDSSEGDEGTQQHPVHTYASEGDYTVSLTVTTSVGSDTETKANFIQVSAAAPPPDVDVAMAAVPAGAFVMGRTDDEWYGNDDELPRHTVTLDAYEIGLREVTAGDFCDMLNWALAQGYLIDTDEEPYSEFDNVFIPDPNPRLASPKAKIFHMKYVSAENDLCPLAFSGGQFSVKERDGHDMRDHPICHVTWFGAIMYCNWLNDIKGLPRCYDESWRRISSLPDGYRLPTEAEWERAAAISNTGYHWRFAVQSDEVGETSCNISSFNPLDLSKWPYTSSVGYYAGTSPVGCFDMTGNVEEWCHDKFGAYTESPQTNPTGADDTTTSFGSRVYRGGDWYNNSISGRTACRFANSVDSWAAQNGFRLARTPSE